MMLELGTIVQVYLKHQYESSKNEEKQRSCRFENQNKNVKDNKIYLELSGAAKFADNS